MSKTRFSGPVYSDNGFVGNITGNVTGNVTGYTIGSQETVTGAGAISPTVAETILVTTGANALTLAAPTIPGFVKVITMHTHGGDGTLASTNIIGQSSGTTSITFSGTGSRLVLVADVDAGKWIDIKEVSVTAA